jgi:hypothetical protein
VLFKCSCAIQIAVKATSPYSDHWDESLDDALLEEWHAWSATYYRPALDLLGCSPSSKQ